MACSDALHRATSDDDDDPFDFDLSDPPSSGRHQPIPRARLIWRLDPDGEAIETVSEPL